MFQSLFYFQADFFFFFFSYEIEQITIDHDIILSIGIYNNDRDMSSL